MRRVILYFITATIAFTVGVAAHAGMNALGTFAVEKFYDDPQMTELGLTTLISNPRSFPPGVHSCGIIVITVTRDRALYLSSREIGTLYDTGALKVTLRNIFEQREQLHAYVAGPELSSTVGQHPRIEKTVYIKAPREVSYGEIVDLIEEIRKAGADPIGLVEDRPIRSR